MYCYGRYYILNITIYVNQKWFIDFNTWSYITLTLTPGHVIIVAKQISKAYVKVQDSRSLESSLSYVQ